MTFPQLYVILWETMETGMNILEQCKQHYRKLGYSVEKYFPNEYYFMFNPKTTEKVRLYYNGKVFES